MKVKPKLVGFTNFFLFIFYYLLFTGPTYRITERKFVERFNCIFFMSKFITTKCCTVCPHGDGTRAYRKRTAFRDVDGLSICVDVDGLSDKRIDILSECASDKLSIRLSFFVLGVRYYFFLFCFKVVRVANEVAYKYKHFPKIVNFRSRSARTLKLPVRSVSFEGCCCADCRGDCNYCIYG